MTKTIFYALSLISIFLLSSAYGQVLHYEDQIIQSISIIVHTKEGEAIDSKAILARLTTKERGFFSQAVFDEDLKLLAQDYDRIEPKVEAEGDHLNIIIDVWPKPSIHSITWTGNAHIDTKQLQKELGVGVFSTYERQTFNDSFHKIKAYYNKKGFFEAEVDYHVDLNSETNEVDIRIEIIEGRSGKIEDILFVNFTESEQHAVLGQLMTKKYRFLWSLFTDEGLYNEDFIQQDRLIITNYLQNQGYADARVDIVVTESCDRKDRIVVTLVAEKGERYYFGDITFEGNCVLDDGKIDRLFIARPGIPFSIDKIRETIEALNDAYGSIGYIDAIVDFDPEHVEGEYRYNVNFKIEEGNQYRVGLVRVFGNTITKTTVILHETLMIPGEIFNTLKLKATEERLLNIGYFKHVNAYIVKGTESQLGGDYRDVYIEVEETTTGQFSGFLGYSSTEEIFGGFNITENNFNHEGLWTAWSNGVATLRGGGEYAHFTAQIGQKSRSFVFSWTKPYFMDSDWAIGFDLSKNNARYISDDYELDTVSLILRGTYNINRYLRWGLQYRLTNGVVHADKHNEELKKESHIHGLISAVGTSLTYESVNHPLKPSKGMRSKLLVEFAGVGGDHTFFSAGLYNSYYYPVGSRMVIKYRADIRFIQPIWHTAANTLPLDERIFLGGDFNVRGYRPYRLGPQFEDSHIPSGGISMQLYSVEMNRRIREDFEVFSFMDAGHLSDAHWDFGRLSVAVGYGARIKLIESIPPITLGMGYPLNAKNRSEVKRFFLSFGGNF